MDIQQLSRLRVIGNEYNEITFHFSELYLMDLENYTDDISIDGDQKTITFNIY